MSKKVELRRRLHTVLLCNATAIDAKMGVSFTPLSIPTLKFIPAIYALSVECTPPIIDPSSYKKAAICYV